MNTEAEVKMDELVQIIRKSDLYLAMRDARSALEADPALLSQVDQFRRKRFLAQTGVAGTGREQAEELACLRLELAQQPAAEQFLQTELGYCRMVRSLIRRFYEGLDLELQFLEGLQDDR